MKILGKSMIAGAALLIAFGVGASTTETKTVTRTVVKPDPKEHCLYAVVINNGKKQGTLPECKALNKVTRLELFRDTVLFMQGN